MRPFPRPALALSLGLLLAAAGCRDPRLGGKGCQRDQDCGSPAAAYRCEPQTGVCYCRTDQACPPTQLCNPSGFCQDRAGCQTNADCLGPGLFCDVTTDNCLPRGRCSLDVQCDLGQVCDRARSTCVPGCRTSGDCPGSSCRCGDVACVCTGTTPEETARCQVGECDPTFCADQSFCRFGEICGVPPDAGTARAQCYSDFDIAARPYCARCTNGGGLVTCGTGANFCIIDTRLNATYCGADCSEGQQCPRGYGCRDIRIVYTRWQCSATQACPGDPTLPCAADADCRLGGRCLKAPGLTTGFCAGVCTIREGSAFGYCSCQYDDDCAQESCSAGECTISRRPCLDASNCRRIHCVDFGGVGGCVIGQNCTPANGLTCAEVQ